MTAPCERATDCLAAIDREPSPELAAHLQICAACRTELAQLRESHELLSIPAVDPPAARLQALQAAVLQTWRAPLWRRVAVAVGVPLSLGLVVALLGWLLPAHPLGSPVQALLLATLPATVCLRPFARRLPWGMVAVALALALSCVRGGLALPIRGVGCLLLLGTSGTLAAALPLVLFARRFVSLAHVAMAALVGGLAVQAALCSLREPAHVVAVHVAPFLLACALFAIVAARRDPAEQTATADFGSA